MDATDKLDALSRSVADPAPGDRPSDVPPGVPEEDWERYQRVARELGESERMPEGMALQEASMGVTP